LTACSTDHEATAGSSPAERQPVAFSAGMTENDEGITRAANEINEDGNGLDGNPTALKTVYEGKGFGVFGCYTGLHSYSESNVHPDFMYNEHVKYDAASPHQWSYSPVKYWPNGEGEAKGLTGENPHFVSFMAYGPWRDETNMNPNAETAPVEYCISSFSKQGELGNPWLVYRLNPNREKQVDLLCASPKLDQTKPAVATPVHFVFRHALACAGDKIGVVCSDGLKGQIKGRVNAAVRAARVVVTSLKIEYTLTSKARLVLWFVENETNDAPMNWQTILSEAPQTKRTVTVLTTDNDIADRVVHTYDGTQAAPASESDPDNRIIDHPYEKTGLGVYYIPAELEGYAQTAKVSIVYHVETSNTGTEPWKKEDDIAGTGILTLKDYNTAYQSGKHLYINITLSPMDIALTAAIALWVPEEPKEMEGIEE